MLVKRWYTLFKGEKRNESYFKYYCEYHYQKEWYNKNPEYNKKWNKNNPEYKKELIEKLGKEFNMTSNEYRNAIEWWSYNIKHMVKDNKIIKKLCKYCGSTKNINAHHIFFKSTYPQLSLNTNNGIPLCDDCHHELHNLNGKKQWIIYLVT